jgi:hypothetical protein
MSRPVLPRVQAMVLCDAVEEVVQEIGVFHLRGVRSDIKASLFPFIRPRLCVYLQMSGHQGDGSCHIQVTQAETDEVVYHTARLMISFEGPMSVVPVVFRLRNCGFPAPGVYYVQVFDGSKLIGERPLHLQAEE